MIFLYPFSQITAMKKEVLFFGKKALSEIATKMALPYEINKATEALEPKQFVNNLSEDLSNHEQLILLQTMLNARLAYEFVTNGEYKDVKTINYSQLANLLSKYNIQPFLLDEKYAIMPVNMATTIFLSDVIDLMTYIADFFDCDNYAKLFSSLCSSQFLINSVGVCYGKVVNPSTKELIAYHAFNLVPVVSSEENGIELYIFEPQIAEYTTIDKPIIANLEYVPILAEFG